MLDQDLVYAPDKYVASLQMLSEGDIVLCMSSGSKHLVGKAAQLRHQWNGSFGTFCAAVRFEPMLNHRFFGHYFSSPDYRSFIREKSSGININNLRHKDVEQLLIPVPPIQEQSRIAAKIEELLTRLDAGVATFIRLQTALKRYKAAVLKAACEGRLVPQDPNDEPAAKVLERILAERRAKWEAEARAKGKDPKKAKYVEPYQPNTDELPTLPEGWVRGSVEQVCCRIVDCLHSTPEFKDSGQMCVDSNCIAPGRIIFSDVRYVDQHTFTERNRRMKPQEDDVVFSLEGALLGIAVRIPPSVDICLGQRMMIFRLSECANATYFETVLNSSVFRRQYSGSITGTASPHLNIGDIRRLAIPCPPVAEQLRIVAEVERRLSVVQELEATIAANLVRAERLRQSILKRAFEGKLVAQDANDEPAGVLLERIRVNRLAANH
jgi:type I restriction enzyme, S subunit